MLFRGLGLLTPAASSWISQWWPVILSTVGFLVFCIFLVEAAYQRCQKMEREIDGIKNQRLIQRDKVLREAMHSLGSDKNKNIVGALLDAGIGELETVDDILFIINCVKQTPRTDELWSAIIQGMPQDDMLPFFRVLARSPIDRDNPQAILKYLLGLGSHTLEIINRTSFSLKPTDNQKKQEPVAIKL